MTRFVLLMAFSLTVGFACLGVYEFIRGARSAYRGRLERQGRLGRQKAGLRRETELRLAGEPWVAFDQGTLANIKMYQAEGTLSDYTFVGYADGGLGSPVVVRWDGSEWVRA